MVEVGQSVIIGPYKKSATASGKMGQVRKKYPKLMEGREFTQVQWLLVSPSTLETLKMYLVTRTK